MTKFGEKLLIAKHGPWAKQYLDYDGLKQILEDSGSNNTNTEITKYFLQRLDEQVEIIALFILSQQGIIATSLHELWQQENHDSTNNNNTKTNFEEICRHILYLVRYIDLNVTGVRKILKKHDKITHNKITTMYLSSASTKNCNRLQVLLDADKSIGILVSSAEKIWIQQATDNNNNNNSVQRTSSFAVTPMTRNPSIVDNMTDLIENRMRRSVSHGTHLHEALLIKTSASTDNFVELQQQQQQDNGQILPNTTTAASITRPRSSVSISKKTTIDPITKYMIAIEQARCRLQESSSLVVLLAAPMLTISNGKDSASRTTADDSYQQRDELSKISDILNLLSSFLYMTNYYIVAPTSVEYAEELGSHASASSLLIGMTSVAALFSSILYSWWTNYSYKHVLAFASTCSLIGNILYALGLPYHSFKMALLGRLFNGFGSARSINRRYIADAFSKQDRTPASATFVTSSSLGMAMGPLFASALHLTIPTKHNYHNLYWQNANSPGWFMAILWGGFLICLLRYFQDPVKRDNSNANNNRTSSSNTNETNSNINNNENDDEEQPTSDATECATNSTTYSEADERTGLLALPNGSNGSVRNIDLTTSQRKVMERWWNVDQPVPIMITFLLYVILKMVLEALLSSTSALTRYYFNWQSGWVGLYMAALGFLMLPANMVVANLAARFDDRELIVGLSLTMMLGCLVVLQYTLVYTVIQYIFGSVLLFVGATALEGPNMSLLSKTIPESWRRGFFNAGLLATEFGTAGRVISDVFLSSVGKGGLSHLLNYAFGSLFVLIAMAVSMTVAFFGYLDPLDDAEE